MNSVNHISIALKKKKKKALVTSIIVPNIIREMRICIPHNPVFLFYNSREIPFWNVCNQVSGTKICMQ